MQTPTTAISGMETSEISTCSPVLFLALYFVRLALCSRENMDENLAFQLFIFFIMSCLEKL